jgi:plastocyanin
MTVDVAPVRSKRPVLRLLLGGLVVVAAFYGYRYFGDPTVGVVGVVTDQVTVVDSAFSPAVIRVPTGTEVEWTFADTEEHNVVFDEFSSHVELTGTYVHTFEAEGEYPYVCTLHPLSMKGRVIVTG